MVIYNFKLLFSARTALAVGVWIHTFHPMRMTDAILPGSSPPRQHKKAALTMLALASPLASSRTKPANMTEHFVSSTQAFWTGRICQHERAHILSLRFLAAGRTSQHERPHSLFFTDSLSHISSSPLSIMRWSDPIYGTLVSGKSFFYHSSFLLNQRILRETNWIFSTPAFNFSILIPLLMAASQLLLWHLAS